MWEYASVVLFKQKTAYEMRISDWSSDVCSSDLADTTGTGEIALNATVAPAGGIGAHKSGAQSAPGWDQNDITVDLTNGGNGQFIGQTETNRSFGNVWCNNAATVTISVAALTSSATTTDTGSFTNRFDVKVTTDAGVYVGEGTEFVLNTAGTRS